MARNEIEPTTEIGKQLEKERINRGLTKTAWALILKTSRPTYNSWLYQPVDIQEVNRKAIATELKVERAVVDEWIRENLRLRVLGLASHLPLSRVA